MRGRPKKSAVHQRKTATKTKQKYEKLFCYHHYGLSPDLVRRHHQTKSAGAEYKSQALGQNGRNDCQHRGAQTDNQESPQIFVTNIPPGYRDWRLISVAHEEGNLNSFAAILGNDVAIKAYREKKLPFPDGTIIAALHYGHAS